MMTSIKKDKLILLTRALARKHFNAFFVRYESWEFAYQLFADENTIRHPEKKFVSKFSGVDR